MHVLELSEDLLLGIFSLLAPFHRDAWLASAPGFMEPAILRSQYSQTRDWPGDAAKEREGAYPLKKRPNALAFTQVCQLWRRAALADPRLWSFVDFWRPPVALEMLDRVGSSPVDIRWEETAPSHALEHVRRRLPSVRMLHVEGSLVHGPLLDFLSGGSTSSPDCLEALRIRVTARDSDPKSMLPLQQFLLRGSGSGALNLTRLELDLHLHRTAVHYDAFLSVLRASPSLVHLSLRHVFSKQDMPISGDHDHNVIRLCHLRKLVLSEMPQIFPAVFLLLDMPSISSVTLAHLMDHTILDTDQWDEMDESLSAQEELKSSSTVLEHMSVECRALSFRETCYEIVEEGVTFHTWATTPGRLSSESNALEVLDTHPEWDHLSLNLDEAIQLVLRSLAVTSVTYLEVHDMGVNMFEANPVTSSPPSVTDWVDILRAMPLLACILVTEYPARSLLRALTDDAEGMLGVTLHTLIMKHAFRRPYHSTPTSVILETALRARERVGHAIPLVKLQDGVYGYPADALAFETAAARWDLCTRVVRIDDEELFPPKT
jgi:hypothetical protein